MRTTVRGGREAPGVRGVAPVACTLGCLPSRRQGCDREGVGYRGKSPEGSTPVSFVVGALGSRQGSSGCFWWSVCNRCT